MVGELLHIRDAIFGDISINGVEKELIESAEFQRLRYVRQTGFAYLVYMGANHTRFEHSIGTMKITKELSNSLCPAMSDHLAIAGLLHDLGHAPFSHTLDDIYIKYLKKTHEDVGRELILKSRIRDILEANGVRVGKVLSGFDGKGIGKIVTGAIGSDRIDYLSRDSHYTGVDYGVIDYERIRGKLALYKGMPAIYAQGVPAAESMLIARYSMWQSVYLHHAVVIAGAMLKKALGAAIECGEFDPHILPRLDDYGLMRDLVETNSGSHLANMINERRLYKRVYYVDGQESHLKISEIGDCLSGAGIGDMDYVVDAPRFRADREDILVLDRQGNPIGKLSNVSPLIKTLNNVLKNKRVLIAAVKKELVPKARAALRKL